MGDNCVVAGGAGLDHLSRDLVGVDNGEGVRWGGEDLGDGGFAGRNGAGEAEEKHNAVEVMVWL